MSHFNLLVTALFSIILVCCEDSKVTGTVDSVYVFDTLVIKDTTYSVDSIHTFDTTFNIDTVYSVDSVIILDTLYSIDTIVEINFDTLIILDSVIILTNDTIYVHDTVTIRNPWSFTDNFESSTLGNRWYIEDSVISDTVVVTDSNTLLLRECGSDNNHVFRIRTDFPTPIDSGIIRFKWYDEGADNSSDYDYITLLTDTSRILFRGVDQGFAERDKFNVTIFESPAVDTLFGVRSIGWHQYTLTKSPDSINIKIDDFFDVTYPLVVPLVAFRIANYSTQNCTSQYYTTIDSLHIENF